MKLLLLTPDLDDKNAIVGFARTWVKRLAEQVERLHVIPVMGGDSPAPNVLVHAMGREQGLSKLHRLWNLCHILTTILQQDKPDIVFIHIWTLANLG